MDDRHASRTHIGSTLPSTPDNLLVKLAHLPLRLVPFLVTRQGQVGEHEVDRGEATIEGLVPPSKSLVQLAPDLLALEGRRSREDGQFGHAVQSVGLFPFASDGLELVVHKVGGLLLDEGNVRLEVFRGETKLDHSLLLHQHLVRTVEHNSLAKDRGGQVLQSSSCQRLRVHGLPFPKRTHGISVLGRDLAEFTPEDQVVTLGTERDRHLPP